MQFEIMFKNCTYKWTSAGRGEAYLLLREGAGSVNRTILAIICYTTFQQLTIQIGLVEINRIVRRGGDMGGDFSYSLYGKKMLKEIA